MAGKASCWRDVWTWFRRLRSRKEKQTEIEDFEAWCKEVTSALVTETISPTGIHNPGGHEAFRRRVREATAKTGQMVSINIPVPHQDLLSSVASAFAEVTVEGDREASVNIRGSTFRNLTLSDVGTISLENCKIARLGASNVNPKYQIKNCMIGQFDVHRGSPIQRMEWDGGYLGRFNLHEDREKAFVGDVWLHGLELSKNPEHHDVQWLRDARIALTARSNLVAAGVFHSSELALSRKREPCINRAASRVYQAFSNYGNSIALPAAWLFGLLLAIGGLAFAAGTVPTAELAASGWQTALSGNGLLAQALRAGIYAMQSVFNPLNLLVPKPLVSVCCWWVALVCFVAGLFGIVAFALFLLSLRRRFKLE
jgi:hypothetical protein